MQCKLAIHIIIEKIENYVLCNHNIIIISDSKRFYFSFNQSACRPFYQMGLFSFKFKYIGGSLVILSIFLSLFKLMEDELYNNIRMIIANLGLIIIVLSKTSLNLKMVLSRWLVSLATFISYLVYHLMIIFWGIEETIKIIQFILDILVIYIISY